MEDYWILEAVIGFLKGPIWNTPVQHFLEQNCYVFGTSEIEEQDEEIFAECKQVHKMYKELVDALLTSFLKDIGCTNDQFIKICDKTKLAKYPAYLELFEQIWATESYELFRSIMVRKNVELELQALVLLQCQLGLMTDLLENEDQILSIVIQRSKDEYERRNVPVSRDDLRMAKQIANSQDSVKTLQKEIDQQDDINKQILEMKLNDGNEKRIELPRPASSRPKQQEQYQQQQPPQRSSNLASFPTPQPHPVGPASAATAFALTSSSSSAAAAAAASSKRIPSARVRTSNDNEATATNIPSITPAQEYLIKKDENLSVNEIERRADFMRKQRELLLERKRIEREKQLETFVQENEEHDPRPMSSRAARAVLDGVDPNAISSKGTANSGQDEKERKKLEARRALAETLKKEVIKNSNKK